MRRAKPCPSRSHVLRSHPQHLRTSGDKAFREVLKKIWSRGWALIQYGWCHTKRLVRHTYTRRKEDTQTKREVRNLRPRGRGLRRNQPCPHLDLGLPASRTEKKITATITLQALKVTEYMFFFTTSSQITNPNKRLLKLYYFCVSLNRISY